MKDAQKVIQPISEVASPVRRREYLVPVVVLKPSGERRWGLNGWFEKFDVVPVLGPSHSDPEISTSAADAHYHVDWRFVDPALRRSLKEYNGSDYEKGVVVWASEVLRMEEQTLTYRAPAVEFIGSSGLKLRAALEPLHVDSVMPASRRCPHRGADLTHCKPDENGIVTCPMHGLRWHTSTGRLAPASEVGKALMHAEKSAPATPTKQEGETQGG